MRKLKFSESELIFVGVNLGGFGFVVRVCLYFFVLDFIDVL